MRWLEFKSEVEVLAYAGGLRINIRPELGKAFLIEISLGLIVLLIGWRYWLTILSEHPIGCVFFSLSTLTALWYQVSGSEEIEIDRQYLVVRRNKPWGLQTREYPLDLCSQLEIRYSSNNEEQERFRFKVAGETITFGRNLSFQQADHILRELQTVMPDEAHRLLAGTDPFDRHFTLLNLN